jgi:CheY-like chemotaxis protein
VAKVLIVDDEPSVVLLMRFILEKVGHKVSQAGNGQEAVALLGIDPKDDSKELPDLILLDVMMPVMDGYTTAIALKNDPRCAGIPIIVVTAKTDIRSMFTALPNVKTFFGKPFDPQNLRDAVAKAAPGK